MPREHTIAFTNREHCGWMLIEEHFSNHMIDEMTFIKKSNTTILLQSNFNHVSVKNLFTQYIEMRTINLTSINIR